jgi:hypothetical protein
MAGQSSLTADTRQGFLVNIFKPIICVDWQEYGDTEYTAAHMFD